MKARTHDLAALSALAVFVVSQPSKTMTLGTALAAFLANQLGGIAPDIDQPTAPFWRNLPIGGFVGRIIGKMLGGHRFITHSILGLALFGFIVNWLLIFFQPLFPAIDTGFVWWAFMIGMASHLVMDSFTKEGVPWLLPLPIKFGIPPIKSWRITTGTWREGVVFGLLIIFVVAYCTYNYDAIRILLHDRII